MGQGAGWEGNVCCLANATGFHCAHLTVGCGACFTHEYNQDRSLGQMKAFQFYLPIREAASYMYMAVTAAGQHFVQPLRCTCRARQRSRRTAPPKPNSEASCKRMGGDMETSVARRWRGSECGGDGLDGYLTLQYTCTCTCKYLPWSPARFRGGGHRRCFDFRPEPRSGQHLMWKVRVEDDRGRAFRFL